MVNAPSGGVKLRQPSLHRRGERVAAVELLLTATARDEGHCDDGDERDPDPDDDGLRVLARAAAGLAGVDGVRRRAPPW